MSGGSKAEEPLFDLREDPDEMAGLKRKESAKRAEATEQLADALINATDRARGAPTTEPRCASASRQLSKTPRASLRLFAMEQQRPSPPQTWRTLAWSTTVLTGIAGPVLLLLMQSGASSQLAAVSAPTFTLALMGVGIIAAATAGHFRVGVLLALTNAACVVVLALTLGLPVLPHPVSLSLAMVIASGSFAARGALFAKTLAHRGWLMALFVVAGEGSVLLIAYVWPGVLPSWFLALLPAQWATTAIQSALTGTGALGAVPVLIALAGTAATTLLARHLWLRWWPYPLMFTTWLGLSALVYWA